MIGEGRKTDRFYVLLCLPQVTLHFRQIQFMLELSDFNLGLLWFCPGSLIFLALSAPVLQTTLAHLIKTQCLCACLLITRLVFQDYLTIVFSTGRTVLDDLNTLFLRGVSSLLHVVSS